MAGHNRIILNAGDKFNCLTVIKFDHFKRDNHGWNRSMWLCKCDCGKETIVNVTNLRKGHIKSCGCLRKDQSKISSFKHGHCFNGKHSRIYQIHRDMLNRCKNSNLRQYKDWGGRGITICDEWLNFNTFHEWAMSHGYNDTLQIDRINNNGNYCPENCRFVDRQTNVQNSRCTTLTKTKVIAMRKLRKRGYTYKQIGKYFKIYPGTAHSVINGKTWSNVV